MIISEHIGDYSQTIRLDFRGNNEVEVRKGQQELYNGVATHIVDTGRTLSFQDKDGVKHEYTKYPICAYV